MNITREELIKAFESWWADYSENPAKYLDYDVEGYDSSKYAEQSTDVLIEHINKVKGENV